MARILVTAATGKVGSQLSRRLVDEGHEVLALTSRPEASMRPAPTHFLRESIC